MPGDAEFWHVHLAARPQMNLRSVGRKRFAHLSESQDEIYVDANIPWGEDTLFTLEFRQDEGGKYAIHTCNNKYLSLNGKLHYFPVYQSHLQVKVLFVILYTFVTFVTYSVFA